MNTTPKRRTRTNYLINTRANNTWSKESKPHDQPIHLVNYNNKSLITPIRNHYRLINKKLKSMQYSKPGSRIFTYIQTFYAITQTQETRPENKNSGPTQSIKLLTASGPAQGRCNSTYKAELLLSTFHFFIGCPFNGCVSHRPQHASPASSFLYPSFVHNSFWRVKI
jgi:hypothetical protein